MEFVNSRQASDDLMDAATGLIRSPSNWLKGRPRLHGNGFIQQDLVMEGYRLHIWDPELFSIGDPTPMSIHDHRFHFESLVMHGIQTHKVYDVHEQDGESATHRVLEVDTREKEDTFLQDTGVLVRAKLATSIYILTGYAYQFYCPQFHETPNLEKCVTLIRKIFVRDYHVPRILLPKEYAFTDGYGFKREDISEIMLRQRVALALEESLASLVKAY